MSNLQPAILKIFIKLFLLFISMTVQTQAAHGYSDSSFDDKSPTKFNFANAPSVNVANVEELYAAINNSANAGNQIVLAAGVYVLSAIDSGGAARPNGGRIELQDNMALRGLVGNRGAVVIDASSLPASSYTTPITNTGAIRMGKGTNAVEWLTIKNSVGGGAGIIAHLSAPGTAFVRIAHCVSTGNTRGIDVRNVGGGASSTASYVLEAEIVDNDLSNNRLATGPGLRIINTQGGSGSVVVATLSGNRSYNNFNGMIVENTGSTSFGSITVFSSGDRFFENGAGAVIGGALGAAGSGNTTNFTANGDIFENNNGFSPFDLGGLILLGAENTTTPNALMNNTVNVELRNCRFGNNQLYDIGAFGARSNPVSVGLPGTNNRVKIKMFGTVVPNFSITDSLPDSAAGMNFATVIRSPVSFDYDGDGRTDLSVFRPSNSNWYLNRVNGGFDAVQFGLATDKLAPADYDGDSKTDLAIFRDGTWWWMNSSNNQVRTFRFGLAGDIPQPTDYDGDGRSEIAVWRPSNATWYVYNLATNQFNAFQLGANGDKPVASDYDGDGKADYGVFRPSNGTWIIQQSRAGLTQVPFGLSTDTPVPADYDGDGKTDLAVFRPTEGNWYLRNSTTGNVQIINWGLATDALVPADYDGDGKADVAIFRDGTWWIRQSASGISIQQFGLANDKPAQSANLP